VPCGPVGRWRRRSPRYRPDRAAGGAAQPAWSPRSGNIPRDFALAGCGAGGEFEYLDAPNTPQAGDPGAPPGLEGQAVLQRGPRAQNRDTVDDTRDFGIGRRLIHANWEALVQVGHQVNQRFLDRQREACQCAPDATTLARVVLPSTEDGLPAPGLRFGDPRTMALLACLCCFQHLFAGLTNRSPRELIAGLIPGYSPPDDLRPCGACAANSSSSGSPGPTATS
jgi:hypothetical protein